MTPGYAVCWCQACQRSFTAFVVGGHPAWCSLKCAHLAQGWRWRWAQRHPSRYRRTRLPA